ncbi:MAG: glycerophosphodiester phosphodiesterase family protein [Opitutaceae bacterium]
MVKFADVEIIAHRGASYLAPENTVAAAQLAWTEGADALEFDIQMTADGQLAVLHDADTGRVAQTALAANAATMAELQRLDVGRWKDVRYAGERIPTINEMLAGVPRGKRVFIEIKGGPDVIPVLGQCLANSRLEPPQIVLIAFDFKTVCLTKKFLPQYAATWILDHPADNRQISSEELIRRTVETGLDGLDLAKDWPIDAAFVKKIHHAGLKLFVWTVDDPAAARHFASAGVDGITTNRPGWLRTQLAS